MATANLLAPPAPSPPYLPPPSRPPSPLPPLTPLVQVFPTFTFCLANQTLTEDGLRHLAYSPISYMPSSADSDPAEALLAAILRSFLLFFSSFRRSFSSFSAF